MDMQKMLDNAVAAMRNERLKTSAQLTIGEIIIHLGNLNNKNLPVLFNFEKARPTCLSSWRGSYCEIAFEYNNESEPKTAEKIIADLKEAIGKTYIGYKGGDFVMGKNTPVWVSNYGESDHRGVVGVEERADAIILLTADCDY
jgi:hypothetical protein